MNTTWGARWLLLVIGAVLLLASLFEFRGFESCAVHQRLAGGLQPQPRCFPTPGRPPTVVRPGGGACRGHRADRPGHGEDGEDPVLELHRRPRGWLTQVPFLPFGNEQGARLFRLLTVLEMMRRDRSRHVEPLAARTGAHGTFRVGGPVLRLSVGEGTVAGPEQRTGDAGARRRPLRRSGGRWALAGVGLGVATALKIIPGLLVIYLLLRGKRAVNRRS